MHELRELTDTELQRVLYEHPEWDSDNPTGDNLTGANLIPLVCPSERYAATDRARTSRSSSTT